MKQSDGTWWWRSPLERKRGGGGKSPVAPYSRYHYHFTGESSSGLVRRGARHLGLWWVRLGVVGVFLVGAGQALGLSEAPVEDVEPRLAPWLISTNLPETSPFKVPEVVAQGFHSPDGIALEPTSGDIYLSDEDASSIYRIQPDGTKREIVNSHTRIYEGDGRFSPGSCGFADTRRRGLGWSRPIVCGGRLPRRALARF